MFHLPLIEGRHHHRDLLREADAQRLLRLARLIEGRQARRTEARRR